MINRKIFPWGYFRSIVSMQWPVIVHLFALKAFCLNGQSVIFSFRFGLQRHFSYKSKREREMDEKVKCHREWRKKHREREEAIWINAIICTHTLIERRKRHTDDETSETLVFFLYSSFTFFYHGLISFIDFNFWYILRGEKESKKERERETLIWTIFISFRSIVRIQT